jgi:ABC-type Fe3+ transport system substrate-binding protein
VSDRQAEFAQKGKAQPFVVDRAAQINPLIPNQAEWQFEDVCGGRGAVRAHPLALVPKQSCFFLGTCQ